MTIKDRISQLTGEPIELEWGKLYFGADVEDLFSLEIKPLVQDLDENNFGIALAVMNPNVHHPQYTRKTGEENSVRFIMVLNGSLLFQTKGDTELTEIEAGFGALMIREGQVVDYKSGEKGAVFVIISSPKWKKGDDPELVTTNDSK